MKDKSRTAEIVLKLCEEHKKNCYDEDCDISLYMIYLDIYLPLVGREVAQKNINYFI